MNTTTKNTPIDFQMVTRKIKDSKLESPGRASIREIKKLIDDIEKATGEKFVRMEMGVPGLPPARIGIEAEIEALKTGIAAIYPDIYGIPQLKTETSRFVKLFMDIDVSPEGCIPTCGSMMGSLAAFMTINRCNSEKDTTLLIDPGFPVHRQQLKVLNQKMVSFDVYNYRGNKLKDKLESILSKGNISCLLYSNPNNPSWICFTETELKIIGDLCNKYDVIAIEDLAYFAMDFRRDLSKPGEPPYQPTVAKYTNNYILTISSSKVFSYAGQRIGMLVISDEIFNRSYPELKKYYARDLFGHSIIFGTIYALSAGITHSTQYALAAIFKAANDGKLNFVEEVKEYGEKAHIMKNLFVNNGFKIVYDKDEDEPIADGFYFTFSYPGFTGEELLNKLLYYGISAISLAITGSERLEGIRACVSLVKREQFKDLEYRLKKFNEDHKK
ncbi:MAG: pyridoxal phosphate-dependent aminotransferase [Ignavibacteriales bacterium]|jgi:aspartate/methionine/tyrosine aminotransferase|nr:pyridoxal phosphate-dependent aminotransferase [Ignavibacterium album]MCZ2269862.1 pyridoxal phosphate-dependent aminotransferase [Ignavibacteriales bacterium]MDD5608380.1 pyridoxal phosphate-dependent aminotransferase [Ignavibacterium sp.]MDX9713014.1 pyridoxal phosphate-dependent aminotransferase [Ignavibacteriaceae bacterium]GIK22963.1 MAG: aminotransferase [Ignavibacteriota bacterium]